MRILILNVDYPEFLLWLYGNHPGLDCQPYDIQMRMRNASLFGVADFYSRNFRQLGHEAWDIHVNNEWMQRAWGREHGVQCDDRPQLPSGWKARVQAVRRFAAKTPLRRLGPLVRPILQRLDGQSVWFHQMLSAQISHYRPDVILNQAISGISADFLANARGGARLVVGQIASPLPPLTEFRCYDLVLSSLPNVVTALIGAGVPAEPERLAFEPALLSEIPDVRRTIPISFVGSLSPDHRGRQRLLECICGQVEVKLWGQPRDVASLPEGSGIRRSYVGPAWGRQMYEILRASRITLNHHINMAGEYANNLRLFEATGIGTTLLTDRKRNLAELFDPSKEVVTYGSPEECVERVRYLLDHEDERDGIARAGQTRTLQHHTYLHRAADLVDRFSMRLS